jgi:flagellar secretion chaperone FliS
MNPGLSYREAAVRGASPVRLVTLLYEQAIEDLRRALGAHRHGEVEQRTREINHALLVLGQLQGTLDKEQGGRVARNLESFYNEVRAGLIDAQCRQSEFAIKQQITNLMRVRDAWGEIERMSTTVATNEPAPRSADGEAQSFVEWKA